MARRGLLWPLGLLASAALLLVSAGMMSAQAGPTDPKEGANNYAQRKAYYDSTVGRPSLRWKCRGIVTLGSAGDPEAIDVLKARYGKAEAPTDHIRYAITNVFRQYFDAAVHAPKLHEFSGTLATPGDAWMWYNMDYVYGKHNGFDKIAAIAKDVKQPMLRRMAAVYAMEDAGKELLYDLITTNMAEEKMPKAERDHSLLLEGMSFALMNCGLDKAGEEFEKVFELVGKHFDEKKTPERTKIVMGRHFAKMFGIDHIYINFDGWRRQLVDHNTAENAKRRTAPPPKKGPEFMGIKGSGKHVAYVIDMSDSMLIKVNKPKAKPKPPEPPKGPITGPGGKKKEEEEKPEPTDEERLPWDKITNRFELAREYLKLSLERLTPDMTFTIIVFGTKAEPIKVTKGMTKVTPTAIAQVNKWFADQKPGSRTEIKKLGTLMGDTNIHGGFLRAFESNDKAKKPAFEYVDVEAALSGCDTIFLLSDGDPNMDDFLCTDKYEPGIRVVNDVESGSAVAPTDSINYQGPYAGQEWLLLDLRRLNLFRHVEMHTLGMGKEANETLLRAIADIGYGKCKMVGNFD